MLRSQSYKFWRRDLKKVVPEQFSDRINIIDDLALLKQLHQQSITVALHPTPGFLFTLIVTPSGYS
ncbi:hypothetical protein [Moorena bouillonii]|uniref:Uncharacterized protein n=1 Tax=Moorena bouillonii PNG TaxID=568701 RepID=A0A1U7N035_9CYAN|nr:hypothetical protein [Moorena bouillonii]OLT59323.1 hypothetical protein BJP37_09965 [Moorena bouillonii PNG]